MNMFSGLRSGNIGFARSNGAAPSPNNGGGNGGNQDQVGIRDAAGGNGGQQQEAKLPVDPMKGMWEDPIAGNPGAGNGNNGGGGQQQEVRQPAKVSDDPLGDHLASLNLGKVEFSQDAITKMSNGDFSPVQEAFSAHAGQIYRQVISDANRLIQAQVKRSVDEAVTKAVGTVNTEKLVGDMHTSLPFTAEEHHAPVAQSVLARAVKKGLRGKEAVDFVRDYYRRLVDDTSETVSDSRGQRQPTPGGGNRGGTSKNTPDWVDFLSQD